MLEFTVSRMTVRDWSSPGSSVVISTMQEVPVRHDQRCGDSNATNGGHAGHEEQTIPADLPESRRERESTTRAAKVVGASGRAVHVCTCT
jgi:hypothetical protein